LRLIASFFVVTLAACDSRPGPVQTSPTSSSASTSEARATASNAPVVAPPPTAPAFPSAIEGVERAKFMAAVAECTQSAAATTVRLVLEFPDAPPGCPPDCAVAIDAADFRDRKLVVVRQNVPTWTVPAVFETYTFEIGPKSATPYFAGTAADPPCKQKDDQDGIFQIAVESHHPSVSPHMKEDLAAMPKPTRLFVCGVPPE
jgi:hypothetical protein